MRRKTLNLLGLRASIFADRGELGMEVAACRPRRQAILSDVVFPELDGVAGGVPPVQDRGGRGQNIWWHLGSEALRAMIEDAGFERVEETARFKYGQRGMPPAIWHAVFRAGV